MTTRFPLQLLFSGVLASIVGLAGAAVTPAQEPAKPKAKDLLVLFIGNSQIYYNDLPRTVEAAAKSAAEDRPRIRTDRFVPGGASLERLWNAGTGKGTARAKILEKKWDFVILQEIYNVKPESFNQYAPLFHEVIQKNGSQTVLFCTASVSQLYPKGFQDLHDMHLAVGKKLHVPVAAAGKAWLSYWGDNPTVEQRLALYDADKAHPGKKGSYIYACTLYAALTEHSPVGLTHRIPKQPANTVTEEEAKLFQKAAWRVHQEINPTKAGTDGKKVRMRRCCPACRAGDVSRGNLAVASLSRIRRFLSRLAFSSIFSCFHFGFFLGSDSDGKPLQPKEKIIAAAVKRLAMDLLRVEQDVLLPPAKPLLFTYPEMFRSADDEDAEMPNRPAPEFVLEVNGLPLLVEFEKPVHQLAESMLGKARTNRALPSSSTKILSGDASSNSMKAKAHRCGVPPTTRSTTNPPNGSSSCAWKSRNGQSQGDRNLKGNAESCRRLP